MQKLQAARPEEWSAVCSDAFVPVSVGVDDTFRGSIRQASFAGIGISRITATPVVVRRLDSHIATAPRDDVFLALHGSGTGWAEQEGRTARLVPNTGAICTTDRPYRWRFDSPMSELVLQVPRARLRLREAALREATGRLIEGRTPGMTVLAHLMTGVLAEGCPPATADQLADTAIELFAAVLHPYIDGRSRPLSGDALLHAARAYMRRHLTDPDLDVAAVARAHAVSRRYLEQLFARSDESPAAYLRQLRLEEALRLLRETSTTVAEIAHLAGFNDVNTFTRAFRRSQGVTPREWRRDWTGPSDPTGNRVRRPAA
ncbi:helix-turn-helix domain-containing protein [Nocardia sp. CA-119907]|uniref:helix-turn-helix domain-containing protein n=1 Tax=Nocardia sp. CA-119907 TaxID=3239973 RepID=UPI003D974E89